jgi:iron complex outermembrane receptor protein
MSKKSTVIAFIILTQTLAKNSTAQELTETPLTESDFFNDFPVVLTATRLKQSQKNSPIATTVIDREMIEASGFTEIPDLLRLAPGMLVNYDSGHIVNAGYQFLFNRYTVRFQVLVDGKSVYTPLKGEMPWTQLGITIDDIDRIEVIRGPSSSSYGPNAMTGVISIITRDAALDKGVKIKLNRGLNGRSEQFVTFGSNAGSFDYKLSLGARKDDGFSQRYDSKELTIANFRGDYQFRNNDLITFAINYNSGDYQEDNTFDDVLHPNHVKSILHTSHQVKWVHTIKDSDNFSINYYHQKYHDRNRYIGNAGGPGIMDESVLTNRHNLEFIHSIYSPSYNLSWGMLLRKDKTTAPQYLYQESNDTVDTRQLFINSEYVLNEHNNINIGILADNNDTGGRTSSYRASLNHHINNNNTLRFSYSTATRSPFIYEEYSNYFIPDFAAVVNFLTAGQTELITQDLEDLDPEEIKSFDIGLVSYLNNNNTELDLRLYKNRLTNLITLEDDIGGFYYSGDAFNVTGFEATIKHRFNSETKAILSYARTKIYADDLISYKASWYETGAPEDNASLLIMHDFGKNINGSLGYYYTGSYQQLCCEEQQQAPRKRLDLSLAKEFKLGDYDSKLKLVIQNITNEEIDTLLLNNYGRQGYISFSMEL